MKDVIILPTTATEKIYYVIQAIEHQIAISPTNSVVQLPANMFLSLSGAADLANILTRLEKDDKAITILSHPGEKYWFKQGTTTAQHTSFGYRLTPTSNFEACSQLAQSRLNDEKQQSGFPSYKAFSTPPLSKAPNIQTPLAVPKSDKTEPQKMVQSVENVSIWFDDLTGYILLNESFLISQPTFDSENYRFFAYVWNNPNRTISLDELNKKLEEPLKKPLAKILENLNFKGPLKEAFFKVSKTSVSFTPSRTIKELEQAGLYPLRLYSTQKTEDPK